MSLASKSRNFIGIFLCLLALCNKLYAKDCQKVDQCKCLFDDGSGTFDLSSLGKQDGTPLIKDNYAADGYAYSFNPCYSFTEGTCVNTAGCQYDSNNVVYYNIGDQASVKFSYDGQNVIGTYTDSGTGVGRTAVVTFICDPSATTPVFDVEGEVSVAKYVFSITSSEACPKKPPAKGSCDKIDQCKCRFGDGTIVDLGTIGRQDGTPLFKDVPAPDGNLYSFNPCYPFTENNCTDIALCQLQISTSLYYKIGDEKTDVFLYDGVNLFVRYSSIDADGVTRTSVVTFICDQSATMSTIRALGEVATSEYIFTVTTSAACPKPAPQCNKVDNCRCTMADGSGTVDLSKLGNEGGAPLLSDDLGPDKRYAFSFNPCYPFSEGTCINQSACLLDVQQGLYYNIGSPTVTFTYDGANVMGTYTASDNVRGSRVTFVCDQAAANATVDVLGELAPSVYGFRVTSQWACPFKDGS